MSLNGLDRGGQPRYSRRIVGAKPYSRNYIVKEVRP
jgi:hypothetical protein